MYPSQNPVQKQSTFRSFIYVGLPSALLASGLTLFISQQLSDSQLLAEAIVHSEGRQARFEASAHEFSKRLEALEAEVTALQGRSVLADQMGAKVLPGQNALSDQTLDAAISSIIEQIDEVQDIGGGGEYVPATAGKEDGEESEPASGKGADTAE